MLVLSRKEGEQIVIGGGIVITVIESHGNQVRLGFTAPNDVSILRKEITEKIARAKNHQSMNALHAMSASSAEPN